MQFFKLSLFALTITHLFTATTAVTHHRSRTGSTTCGPMHYTAAHIHACERAACDHIARGTGAGPKPNPNRYPCEYQNREGFRFQALPRGTFWEFPLTKEGRAYTGGELGPLASDVVLGTDDVCVQDRRALIAAS
ncbi:ribonuclease [Neofusicoccum parvum]|uniref:Ribonuclease n=1 Tax=Neofusicoccum parvum TaxID=310453 RepID=A0ACB5SE58_9PEZI|nr:ribonuclease [Neofusicoccum parvum]